MLGHGSRGALTLRDATLLVISLCLGAIALALGATQAVERAHPGITRPDEEAFAPLRIAKLDVHTQVPAAAVDMALRVAHASGIGAIVNLAGGAEGGDLEGALAAAQRSGGRVIVFMNPSAEGCCGDEWIRREAARLARGKALGARGVAVLGEPPGADLASPGADPLWDACGALKLPVALGEVGRPEDRLRIVERHPRVDFVLARLGDGARDPTEMARLMDRLPNLWMDTSARLPRPGLDAAAARQALLAHPDRVLFGSGVRYVASSGLLGIVLRAGQPILLDAKLLGGDERRAFFASTFRFFETRDAGISSPTPGDNDGGISGVGLPGEVLQRIYHRNAERLLHVRAPEVEE